MNKILNFSMIWFFNFFLLCLVGFMFYLRNFYKHNCSNVLSYLSDILGTTNLGDFSLIIDISLGWYSVTFERPLRGFLWVESNLANECVLGCYISVKCYFHLIFWEVIFFSSQIRKKAQNVVYLTLWQFGLKKKAPVYYNELLSDAFW